MANVSDQTVVLEDGDQQVSLLLKQDTIKLTNGNSSEEIKGKEVRVYIGGNRFIKFKTSGQAVTDKSDSQREKEVRWRDTTCKGVRIWDGAGCMPIHSIPIPLDLMIREGVEIIIIPTEDGAEIRTRTEYGRLSDDEIVRRVVGLADSKLPCMFF